eukprot:scaffold6503_cov115-Isochrysis_galbana.AAC.2
MLRCRQNASRTRASGCGLCGSPYRPAARHPIRGHTVEGAGAKVAGCVRTAQPGRLAPASLPVGLREPRGTVQPTVAAIGARQGTSGNQRRQDWPERHFRYPPLVLLTPEIDVRDAAGDVRPSS